MKATSQKPATVYVLGNAPRIIALLRQFCELLADYFDVDTSRASHNVHVCVRESGPHERRCPDACCVGVALHSG